MVALPCFLLDQATKAYAEGFLRFDSPKTFVSNILQFAYTENEGAFGGAGANLPPTPWSFVLCGGAAGLILLLVLSFFRGKTHSKPAIIGLSLMISGGLSNLMDRIASGFVVDFFSIRVGPLEGIFFNGADLAIFAGLCLLVSDRIRSHFISSPQSAAPMRRLRPMVVRK